MMELEEILTHVPAEGVAVEEILHDPSSCISDVWSVPSLGLNTSWSHPLEWSDLMTSWDGAMAPSTIEDLLLEIPISDISPILVEDVMATESSFQTMNDSIPSLPAPMVMSPPTTSTIPQSAVYLLKHYSAVVLLSLTPFQHSKTPWHILFIPHVKSCLAALTLGEDMDHASLCAFLATLAVSAYSLGGISNCSKWLDQAEAFKQQARQHARMMLKTAYDVPKKAKYKSILMALLSMVHISMISSNQDQTECYFLEAEKLIRLRGLNRRKSRKVRLLHHCYAYERLLYESTFKGSTHSAQRRLVRRAIESCGATSYSHDSLSFQLGDWNNLDQAMLRIKVQEEGENDLHLQLPGIWSATLYPEIFGISEMHMFLLSLIIRLGREKEKGELNSINLNQFLSRASALERCIAKLADQNCNQVMTLDNNAGEQQHSQQLLDILSEAMRLALSVLFYRRIYNLEPSMLQAQVVGIHDCLQRFEAADQGMGHASARLVWPVFIAAREAQDRDIRLSFATWFKDSASRSGLQIFRETASDLEDIWKDNSS
jgi:hypothetical protein